MWVSVLVYPKNMAQPSPESVFHFLEDVVDANSSTNFPVGSILFPSGPGYSS